VIGACTYVRLHIGAYRDTICKCANDNILSNHMHTVLDDCRELCFASFQDGNSVRHGNERV